jgi:adhesin transport system outer membrane protein
MKHLFVSLIFISSQLFADTAYQDMIELCARLTQNHPRVLAEKKLLMAAKQNVKVELGVFYPNLNLNIDQSFTKLENHTSTNPSQDDRDVSLSISQLIYDFGKSNTDIAIAVQEVQEKEYDLENSKQAIFLEGLELCLDIVNTWRQVQFESISADNFKQQMELETTKVKKGQGYSTDVLQAEAQWLGAQNRKLQLQSALTRLTHDFESLFGESQSLEKIQGQVIRKNNLELPNLFKKNEKDDHSSSKYQLKVKLLSQSSEDELNLEMKINDLITNNPRLQSLKTAIKTQELNRKSLRQNRFAPKLSGVISGQMSQSDSASNPFQKQSSASLELSFPFNLGLTSLNEVALLSNRIQSLEHSYENQRRELVKSLKDQIINWKTANQSIALLKRQVEISEKFLEGAEKERTMGRRSLIDVINGELILIRAKSSLEQAEIQSLKSWFRYLSTIGNLALGKL